MFVRKTIFFALASSLLLLAAACSSRSGQTPTLYQNVSSGQSEDTVQITFQAHLPEGTPGGDTIHLVIQDEVTGLPYNQTRVKMSALGNGYYGVVLNLFRHNVVKYYYERFSGGANIPEMTSNGGEIRYRLYAASSTGQVEDQVAAWSDSIPTDPPAGRIEGVVLDAASGRPLADILVSAGGLQTISDGNGHFTLYPLSPGKHNLIGYALNGSYHVFQQEALVADHSATPAELRMQTSSWVTVTFVVTAPENTVEGAVMRIAGNLSQFGNTFSDLGAGISGDANMMPVMASNGNRFFSVKMNLPTETEILYKYTLGDGFWNCEHDANGSFYTRRLYLPAVSEPILVEDTIVTWKTSQSPDIWFSASTPANTPVNDSISIQFQLANWMPGLPMYKIGDNQWVYPLISPQNFSGPIAYRYCRNGQCSGELQLGIDGLETPRETSTQFNQATLIDDSVESWNQFAPTSANFNIPSGVSPREAAFTTGIAFSPYYSPTWEDFITSSITEIRQSNANLAIISPSWDAVDPQLPLMFTPHLGGSQRWYRTAAEIETIHDQGLKAGLFPQLRFSGTALQWWQSADTDNENWWLAWFEQYRNFLIQYADLAEITEADVLVLGGDWVLPTLPIADNAATFNLPGSVESLWLEIISDIREHYHGPIAWHIPVSMLGQAPVSVLSAVDQIYLQWDAPLATSPDSSVEQMTSQATILMELHLQPVYREVKKPILIMLAYPSAVGSDISCIPTSSSDPACLNPTSLLQGPVADLHPEVDLQLQVDLYTAVLAAVEYQDWISGVVSQGWYPPLGVHDASASIHGKPAQTVLAEWFKQFLGN